VKAVWGGTPNVRGQLLRGREQDGHSVRDVVHERKEEEGWNGDERMLSAGRIGRMTATRAGYYLLLSLCKAKSTRE
jgi:hypothetical protein